nr:caffeate O-methyltransferase (COMT) family [Tanacetum cinerariifolium]
MTRDIKTEKINSKDKEVAAQEEIWKFIHGFTPMAVVKCAIELGIADILEKHESPMTLVDLALELGCSKSSLYRIMRFLIHYKVFQEKPVSETSIGYVLTPLSRLLTKTGKHSMADFVLLESSPVMLAPWHKLSAWVLGNKDLPFEAAHNTDLWGYTAANPSHSELFDRAMACDALNAVAAMIKGCPEVFEGVKNSGNMFDHVPKADAVYLMKVLHDWSDKDCIRILRNCRDAIPQDGKVIIVDAIVGRKEDHEFKVGLLFDMVMIAHTRDGKERTIDEWSYVLHEAGFTRYTLKHIQAYQSVIEAYP